MSYLDGDRYQMEMLPPSIEDYVGADDPVRVYDEMIDAMNMDELGIVVNREKLGRASYHPAIMLKLLVYAYSYGWRSSRKIERALHHNLSFIWLAGGLKPDHKTIAEFRRNNKKALKNVLRQCALICLDLKLIEGNCLFVDGSKFRGSASIDQTKSREAWKRKLEALDERVSELLDECDKTDEKERGCFAKLSEELQNIEKRRGKIKRLLKIMDEKGLSKINGTDPDAVNFKSRQGSHAGFNAQIAVDDRHGLIVSCDAVSESNDFNQFSEQMERAAENLGEAPKIACGDAGYSKVDNLKKTTDKGIDVVVPSQRQSLREPKNDPFGKDKFVYDRANNQYVCPEGRILRYSHYSKTKNHYLYRIKGSSNCLKCRHFGVCTKSSRGRSVVRLFNEDLKEKLESRYASSEGQNIYKRRKEKVELPFGHMKRNLGAGYFLLRGLDGVKAEFSLLSSCFNIVRTINLLGGVIPALNRLRTVGGA